MASLATPRLKMPYPATPAKARMRKQKATASLALMVKRMADLPDSRSMTGGGRDRLAGVLLLIEDGLEVGNDDELAAALDQALDELGPPAHADAGRRLRVGAGQGGDFVDLVGAKADQGRFAGQFDLDDHDPAVDGGGPPLQPEGHAQVGQGNDLAAEVDDRPGEGAGAGHHGLGRQVHDFLHADGVKGEQLAIQFEGQDLDLFGAGPTARGGAFGVGAHMASRICASCCWPLATRWPTSRIRATPPSPRIVAPEKVGRPEWSLDIDLITVWWSPMI